MATPAAALKLMRSICLSLPDTSEGTHYGKASFKVGRKMFATCGEEKVGYGMIVALEAEHCKLVLATDPRFTPFREYPNCVFLAAADMNDRNEIGELVAESYGIVAGAAKPSKRSTTTTAATKKAPTKSTTDKPVTKKVAKKP